VSRSHLKLLIAAVAVLVVAGLWLAGRFAPPVPILMYHRISPDQQMRWSVTPEPSTLNCAACKPRATAPSCPPTSAPRAGVPGGCQGARSSSPSMMATKASCAMRTAATQYRFRAIAYLVTSALAEDPAQRRTLENVACLTWPEIRAMRDRGVFVFGAHGHRHVRLDRQPDPAADLRACRAEFVAHAGSAPDSFCYPFGAYTPELVRLGDAAVSPAQSLAGSAWCGRAGA